MMPAVAHHFILFFNLIVQPKLLSRHQCGHPLATGLSQRVYNPFLITIRKQLVAHLLEILIPAKRIQLREQHNHKEEAAEPQRENECYWSCAGYLLPCILQGQATGKRVKNGHAVK